MKMSPLMIPRCPRQSNLPLSAYVVACELRVRAISSLAFSWVVLVYLFVYYMKACGE
jgi:hypothetical protein